MDEVRLEKCAHIPSDEIERDIRDTEREIVTMAAEIVALETVPVDSFDYRMAQFRAAARRDGIKARVNFIVKLRALLDSRTAQRNSEGPEA